jgi:FkbM family methyltransferase
MPRRDLVYDIGLHQGEDTALYLAMGYRVIAFEADPEHCAAARQRFAEAIATDRLEVVEGAIAAGEGTVTFYRHAEKSDWGTIDPNWVARNEPHGASTPVTVPIVDLAAKISESGVPYYAKIDIEGTDRFCLEVLGSFEERPAYVSIEASKTDWRELEKEFDLLEGLGYDRFAVVQQSNIGGSTLSSVTLDGDPLTCTMEPSSSGPFGRDLANWGSRSAALARYRGIFLLHRIFGDEAITRRTALGRRFVGRFVSAFPYPLNGWHDTHARHRHASSGPG